jgi:Peptidase family M23
MKGWHLVIPYSVLAAGSLMAQVAQVPTIYSTANELLRVKGRAVTDLVASGDASTLYALFNRDTAAAIAQGDLKAFLDQIRAASPLGAPEDEAVWPSSDIGVYATDRAWGSQTLTLQVVFDRDRAIAGLSAAPRTPLPPDPKADYQTRSTLRLPFEGDWWTFWGGRTALGNYHVIAPDQRHAYDFVVWADGATHRGDGSRNDDYWDWGRPVLAPGPATVLSMRNDVADNRPLVSRSNPSAPAGNHVILDVGNGEYVLIAHFQRGSLRVQPGDHVEGGQVLGLCGNSGNSSEPHVHIHLQDRAGLFGSAVGLPLAFANYLADGRHVDRGEPLQGQFIRSE